MASAKEIKAYAAEYNISNADARKALKALEVNTPKDDTPAEISDAQALEQVRSIAKNDDTIALGLVVEKKGSGKPGFSLPKLKKNSPFFRVDVTLNEIDVMSSAARHSMPGATLEDIAFIIGDGLKENAHLENGEQFAAILCAYLAGTDAYMQLKDGVEDPKCKGVIIRVISYKDGYVIRPSDYIRSYNDVDQSFAKMKIQ